MRNKLSKINQITRVNLRKPSAAKFSSTKILRDAIALFPRDKSDPVLDNLYGSYILEQKEKFLKERLLKTTEERTRDNLKELYSLHSSRLRESADCALWEELECMKSEKLLLRQRLLQHNFDLEPSMGADFMLAELPRRLARFREPSCLVEDNLRVFLGQNAETSEDLAFMTKSLEWKRSFEDESGVFEEVQDNEVCVSHLPPDFNAFEFWSSAQEKGFFFSVERATYDIFGKVCSLRLSFKNKEKAMQFFQKAPKMAQNTSEIRLFSHKTAADNCESNRTVVFLNLPESISEREFLTKLATKVSITKASCPKLRPEGTLPRTSELVEYLRSERPEELKSGNVSIMEFGASGWRQLRFDGDEAHSPLDLGQFMANSADRTCEELSLFREDVAKNFRNYFEFLQREIARQTFFSVEDPRDFTSEVRVADVAEDLSQLEKSVFFDENSFLSNLRSAPLPTPVSGEHAPLRDDFETLKAKIVDLLWPSDSGATGKTILREFLTPFLNLQTSDKLEKLLADLATEWSPREASQLQNLFEPRNFGNALLQRNETHKGFIVVQFASAFEAKKAIFFAKLEVDADLHMLLLNDLGLHDLDPDFKARKLREVHDAEAETQDVRAEIAKKLQADLEKVRRREFLHKFQNAEAVQKETFGFKAGEEQRSMTSLRLNELSPKDQIFSKKRNRIRDRETIRKEFQALFDKLSRFPLNNSLDFSFNLAGLESVASKMRERGRKVNGLSPGTAQTNFQEELQTLRERRQNYLEDAGSESESRRRALREEIRKTQDQLVRFEYEDVREELRILLSEHGLNDLQKQSFEEMVLLTADLRDLLDGSSEIPTRVSQKIDRARTLRDSTQLLKRVSAARFSTVFGEKQSSFLEEMKGQFEALTEEEIELRKFQRELQLIYSGQILDVSAVKDFLQTHFDRVRARPNDFQNDFLHILTRENKPFIPESERQAIMQSLYPGQRLLDKEAEITRQAERQMVHEEANTDQTFRTLRLQRRLEEFFLRDGVAVGFLRLKEEVAMDAVEVQELVDLLNYSDLDFEYEPVQDDLKNLFLIKKLRGFRFNVSKYLFYVDQMHLLAQNLCKTQEVPFDDFLRMETGLPCSSASNEQKVREKVLQSDEFAEGIAALREEFFTQEEWARIGELSGDTIEEEILLYKAHLSMRTRLGKLESKHLTRPVRQREVVTNSSGKINTADYDVIINN